jgi:hypothetical protein
MKIKHVYTTAAALMAVLLLPSCAVTTAPTEASSETTGNTTNATSDLTSSTSAGDEAEEANPDAAVESFIKNNSSQLRNDMAAGKGEYLNTYAILLGIHETKRAQFYEATKNNFDQIFYSSNSDAAEIIERTRQVIESSGI